MTTDQIDQPAERGAAIALGTIAVLTLLSCGGCISTTVYKSGPGDVTVSVEKWVSTDASIPASIIP